VTTTITVVIGGDNSYLSADDLLTPARKDRAPPDLKYRNISINRGSDGSVPARGEA